MKWRLVIRPRAETDLREAHGWYESQHPGLGAEFLVEIDSTIQVLMRDPQRHPIYYRGFYRVLVRRFLTRCFTDWRVTGSLCFEFYTRAAIIPGFLE